MSKFDFRIFLIRLVVQKGCAQRFHKRLIDLIFSGLAYSDLEVFTVVVKIFWDTWGFIG